MPPKQKPPTAWVAFSGAAAGVTAHGLLQPLDVIKTRVITQHSAAHAGEAGVGSFRTAYNVVQQEGIAALWRGSVPTMIRVGCGAGVFFSVLGTLMTDVGDAGEKKKKSSKLLVVGAVSRSASAALMCPLAVVKTRMEAVRGQKAYSGVTHALRSIAATEGARGLYAGLLPTLIRDVPYAGLYVLFYNRLKEYGTTLGLDATGVTSQVGAAFVGAVAATLVTHPADVVRTHRQVAGSHGGTASLGEAVRLVMRTRGLAGFIAGLGPRLLKRGLSNSILWPLCEQLQQAYPFGKDPPV